MTPAQKKARARLGGLTAAAMGRSTTVAATAAAEARYEREVREEAAARGETLTDVQITRRAAAKRELFYARLSCKSARYSTRAHLDDLVKT